MDIDYDSDLEKAIALSLTANEDLGLASPPALGGGSIVSRREGEEDDDLRAAIALSLTSTQKPVDKPSEINYTILDLVSEDDDDDLDAPVTRRRKSKTSLPISVVSMASSPSSHKPTSLMTDSVPLMNCEPSLQNVSKQTTSEFSKMDREQMEQERLARLNKKRKLPGTCVELSNSKKPKIVTDLATLASHVQHHAQNGVATLKAQLQLRYPDGVVRRTWAYGTPRQSDDIKIEEVLQKEHLELAVFSTFQIDVDWIISKLDPKTKIVWVLQAKSEAERINWRRHAPKNYKFCFPQMENGVNCMHSKLQLLAYPTHLRVVVPSANLTSYDWGETGVMENTCFIIDLPRHSDLKKSPVLTDFGIELLYFVEALGLEQSIIESLKNFDFSRTKQIEFVHSIGGKHAVNSLKKTGFPGLANSINSLGLSTSLPLEIDFVASSIGSLKPDFLWSLYHAAQGSKVWAPPESGGVKQTELSEKPASGLGDLVNRFRIYFPTRDTVAGSKGGHAAAGTICFSSRFYDAKAFPRELMRDCRSQRPGLLMHNKMMFVRGEYSWAYIGSANLSESAWGSLTKDRTTKQSQLVLRNWECGVIIPVQTESQPSSGDRSIETGVPTFDIFKGHVPIPMVTESTESDTLRYGNKRPWFFL